jgi:hypothetical protein
MSPGFPVSVPHPTSIDRKVRIMPREYFGRGERFFDEEKFTGKLMSSPTSGVSLFI